MEPLFKDRNSPDRSDFLSRLQKHSKALELEKAPSKKTSQENCLWIIELLTTSLFSHRAAKLTTDRATTLTLVSTTNRHKLVPPPPSCLAIHNSCLMYISWSNDTLVPCCCCCCCYCNCVSEQLLSIAHLDGFE